MPLQPHRLTLVKSGRRCYNHARPAGRRRGVPLPARRSLGQSASGGRAPPQPYESADGGFSDGDAHGRQDAPALRRILISPFSFLISFVVFLIHNRLSPPVEELLSKAIAGQALSRDDACRLIRASGTEVPALMMAAGLLRDRSHPTSSPTRVKCSSPSRTSAAMSAATAPSSSSRTRR